MYFKIVIIILHFIYSFNCCYNNSDESTDGYYFSIVCSTENGFMNINWKKNVMFWYFINSEHGVFKDTIKTRYAYIRLFQFLI